MILTHDTLNRIRRTVVVVPISSVAKSHPPVTVPVTCRGNDAVAVIDRLRAVDKKRLQSRLEALAADELEDVCRAVSSILELR